MMLIWQDEKNGDSKVLILRAMVVITAILWFALHITEKPVCAEEEDTGNSHIEGYESRIYGIVEKCPPGNIGNWTISKRDVKVNKKTRIIEKYGKAEVGAYVEVKGNNTGKTFFASRIEVKRTRPK